MGRFLRIFIVALLCVVPLMRCATISAPMGGPRDSMPPILVSTTPALYTTNFKGKKITLTFNEFVQLREQSKLFFMSPPAVIKPTLTIKGRSVVIELQDTLIPNTTYKLDFGSAIADNNEGNSVDDFSYIFSTGDYIDSLMMAGQALDAYTRDTIIGGFVYYFDQRADSLELDSTMFISRADALFRTDSSGYFVADILKDKPYRIYAMADDNGNQQYEAGTDMVAFRDSTYNPALGEGFTFSYDSLTRKTTLDTPQVIFELFKEPAVKRQNILEHLRPMQQKMSIIFASPHPTIDTLDIEGVPAEWLIKEWGRNGDTLTMWLNPPLETKVDDALRDTLNMRIAYQKQDSVWNFYSHGQTLDFVFKRPAVEKKKKTEPTTTSAPKPKKKRRGKAPAPTDSTQIIRDSLARDSAELAQKRAENPFKMKVGAQQTFIPLGDITFDFDVPMLELDPARIELKRIHKVVTGGRGREKERMDTTVHPFTFTRDTADIYRWRLKAKWTQDDSYKLFIPSKVFNNIARQWNDTLQSTFTVANTESFSTFVVSLDGDSSVLARGGSYILEVLSGSGKQSAIMRRITGVKVGDKIEIPYFAVGNYRLKIVEDINNNGQWDTGSLTHRRPPERTRIYAVDGSEIIIAKENWSINIPIKLGEMFGN